MIPTRFTVLGATLFAIGMLVVGLALSTGFRTEKAFAGNGNGCPTTPTPDPTADPSASVVGPSSQDLSAQQAAPECTATSTKKPNVTRTPTRTATPEASNTAAPSATRPAPTATSPGGGVGSGGLQPPDTGTGPSSDNTLGMLLMTLGAVVAAAGGGFVLLGVTRRR